MPCFDATAAAAAERSKFETNWGRKEEEKEEEDEEEEEEEVFLRRSHQLRPLRICVACVGHMVPTGSTTLINPHERKKKVKKNLIKDAPFFGKKKQNRWAGWVVGGARGFPFTPPPTDFLLTERYEKLGRKFLVCSVNSRKNWPITRKARWGHDPPMRHSSPGKSDGGGHDPPIGNSFLSPSSQSVEQNISLGS